MKCNVVHYSWGALMINQYHGQESQLGGLTVLSYFGEQSGFRGEGLRFSRLYKR